MATPNSKDPKNRLENTKNKTVAKDQVKEFTVQPEDNSSQVPSITRLLNRRPLAPPKGEPPKVQPAGPRRSKTSPPPQLLVWDAYQLKKSKDPLSKGLLIALTQGATSALFLKASTEGLQPGSPPLFVSTAIAGETAKKSVWRGLVWDPSMLPEVWTPFIQSGQAEFPPPEGPTNIKSNRNMIRSAFGVLPGEWLTLVRVGSSENFRGTVALISRKSLFLALSEAFPFIFKTPK